jgi:signal peptidase I
VAAADARLAGLVLDLPHRARPYRTLPSPSEQTMKAIAKKRTSGGVVEAVKTIVYAVLIALVVRTVAYEPFNIPSGSMIPTLLVGDYLFVSKFSYGYSRYSLPLGLPLFSGRIFEFHKPERGDVVVFWNPLAKPEPADFIKRLVGLPGDKVQVIHGQLFINGQMVPRRQVDDYVFPEGAQVEQQYIESLPRGPGEPPLEHPIIKVGDNGPLDDTPVYEVPEGHYFMMGDNRDNSEDSRVMSVVGFVPAENIVGKAQFLFFSTNGTAAWWQVWEWPFAIRYWRLLRGIH